ncbi:hypothetical protein DL546_002169 [Coniochaeta pulveracea]|uniref:Uncharacterized protein n=1 Tax=Coniochaeta pulveracea TaxID=177199 RepID=A0A420Y3C0_9PEZI|nr:hypothetical protein DL546_002169 [Coniochaeta pulveracea]
MVDSIHDDLISQVVAGQYEDVLTSSRSQEVINEFAASLQAGEDVTTNEAEELDSSHLSIGLASFNAFLQTNVTGPVLSNATRIDEIFQAAAQRTGDGTLSSLRKACFRALDVDGVSPYPYIPSIELFCLARHIFTRYSTAKAGAQRFPTRESPSLRWHALRVHVWHYRLLTQPSLGPGSLFNKAAQWSEVPSLENEIQTVLGAVEEKVMWGGEEWSAQEKARFLVEKANVCITLGLDVKARAALREATELTRFKYALSGALGRRTKFQEKSTSQLVVLARSADETEVDGPGEKGETQAVPQALPLNNDTLLEDIEFSKEEGAEDEPSKDLPEELQGMAPDEQPQLKPLDQIILLTEATIKDAFSPTDTLTSEEIMPFAVRVVSDKSTNWQIYTQALLVRSRIEVHRSRTIERGVLQMQAVVDQVVADTTTPTSEPPAEAEEKNGHTVPFIEVSGPDDDNKPATKTTELSQKKVASFFPAAKPTESAPAHVRLEYIHALSSPPRWHLESELAYCWAGVGSLISALEIFKRLRLWAEVALCLASSAATEDEDGRGSGGEEKAKAVLRWRLFRRTNESSAAPEPTDDLEEGDVDVEQLKSADYMGAERDPPPPNAPRLFCILGDIENDPKHYERAWDISKQRYARAQKSLGEWYLQHKEWNDAREAYRKAVAVNRMNPELWNRFGDINLRLGDFAEAAEAYRRAIASADNISGGEEARTWSNLGSALYSLYVEEMKELKKQKEAEDKGEEKSVQPAAPEDDEELSQEESEKKRHPSVLLSQSLAAYKRGASIANDNWQIWDNVITLAARMRPVPVSDILLALRNVIRIRSSEDALDIDVLRLLLNEAVLSKPKPETTDLPRGTEERAVCDLLETAVVPLITARSDLWELISRERVWRRDYAGAVDAAERAWRAAVGGAGAGLAVSAATSGEGQVNWVEDKEGWKGVVERTDELVSALENYGPEIPEIGNKWKAKARSAIRSVMGKAKENWEGSEEWESLKGLLEGLR